MVWGGAAFCEGRHFNGLVGDSKALLGQGVRGRVREKKAKLLSIIQ